MSKTESTDDYPHDNFMDALKATNQQFRDEYDDLEAILEGDIGFHAFFVAEGDDPTRGANTAIFQGLFELLEEIDIDATIIEHNYGEVTPETARKEAIAQINEFTYLPDRMAETIGDAVEERVRNNMRARGEEGDA